MESFLTIIDEKWIVIDEKSYDKISKPTLDAENWQNLEDSFPSKIDLNEEEIEKLKYLEQKSDWLGKEFLEIRKLQKKRGISEDIFLEIQNSLKEIKSVLKKEEIQLPNWFQKFFSNLDYLSRFRFGDISFQVWRGVIKHPKNPDWYVIPLLGNSQGFCWWGLLLDRIGNSIVIYRDTFWEEDNNLNNEKEFRCSDSLEEFLFRMSSDLIEKEKTNFK